MSHVAGNEVSEPNISHPHQCSDHAMSLVTYCRMLMAVSAKMSLRSGKYIDKSSLSYAKLSLQKITKNGMMGQRTNRKRIRHRPNRPWKTQNSQPITGTYASSPHADRWTSPSPYTTTFTNSYCWSGQKKYESEYRGSERISESAAQRELRIFGGLEGERDQSDLRSRMLDVVLGLFHGLDYEDAPI
ncbi:hypothetical protein M433DRAFT_409654 [Acidomyces richmondensis BFW]|nr:hypothetical protein M433DRAFT_409654 [Acidomyces richmondensis BFW]